MLYGVGEIAISTSGDQAARGDVLEHTTRTVGAVSRASSNTGVGGGPACVCRAVPDGRGIVGRGSRHYRQALDTPERRQASAVLPGRVLASRNFFIEVEAGLADLAQLPTLIVWGDADIAFRSQERERLEATFPDHKTVIIEGAGTYVESDAPEEFVAAIRDWAEQHSDCATPRSASTIGSADS